jgi:DNA-binding winged helix-turn-helix (wHTH) protein
MKVAFDRFTFDSETRQLLQAGTAVHLSPKGFDLLQVLLERRPAVVSKAELQAHVWPGTFVEDAGLSVLVADIRRALDDDPRQPAFIRTVHGRGYAFCGTAIDVAGSVRPDAPLPSRCWVTWREHTRNLTAGPNIIGRDPACEVWIDAPGVSRRHARISVMREGITLEDLASTNGTFLGRRRVTSPQPLSDGDRIGLGDEMVTFRVWSETRPRATEPVGRRRKT